MFSYFLCKDINRISTCEEVTVLYHNMQRCCQSRYFEEGLASLAISHLSPSVNNPVTCVQVKGSFFTGIYSENQQQ